jgi:hypothetical protein
MVVPTLVINSNETEALVYNVSLTYDRHSGSYGDQSIYTVLGSIFYKILDADIPDIVVYWVIISLVRGVKVFTVYVEDRELPHT